MGSRLPTQIRENQPHARTPNRTQSQGLASKHPDSPSSALSLGPQATLSGVQRVSGTEAHRRPSGKADPAFTTRLGQHRN